MIELCSAEFCTAVALVGYPKYHAACSILGLAPLSGEDPETCSDTHVFGSIKDENEDV